MIWDLNVHENLYANTTNIETVDVRGAEFQFFTSLNMTDIFDFDVRKLLCQLGCRGIHGDNVGRGKQGFDQEGVGFGQASRPVRFHAAI